MAASVALGLTGCGGGSQAADPTDPTPTSVKGATSAPGPAPNRPTSTTQARPSSVRATQEAAAIALVRTYVDEYNKALKSGSTTAFRETFKQTCAFCLGNATIIDGVFMKNQRLRGLQSALDSPRATLHDSRQIFVEGQLSQAGGQVLSASGAEVKIFKQTRAVRVLWRVKPGSPPVIFGSEIR
jgi:hypothetical protein